MKQRVLTKKGGVEVRGAGIREGILRVERPEELVNPRGHRSHGQN